MTLKNPKERLLEKKNNAFRTLAIIQTVYEIIFESLW